MSKAPVTKYTVVSETSVLQLVDSVNDLIKHGWEPLGGLQIRPQLERPIAGVDYMQPMIYREYR